MVSLKRSQLLYVIYFLKIIKFNILQIKFLYYQLILINKFIKIQNNFNSKIEKKSFLLYIKVFNFFNNSFYLYIIVFIIKSITKEIIIKNSICMIINIFPFFFFLLFRKRSRRIRQF